MHVRIQKSGNSLAVKIPRPPAEDAKIKEGAILNVTISGGKIVATPTGQKKLSLKRLLARVKRRNLHAEVNFGPSDGQELWCEPTGEVLDKLGTLLLDES